MNFKLIQSVLCLAATLGPLSAGNPQFGMVGLASGQTLRLNVVAYPPNPCSATLSFRNANGLYPVPQPDKTVTLQPGQADFLDLNANTLLIQFGQRMELRPVVTLTNSTVGACRASVEVIDNLTGFSALAVIPQPVPDQPQPDPSFGMAGIALGQVLRLNVVAYPPNPCSATLGFRDRNGQPVPLPDKIVTLQPGQAASLDVSAASLGVQFGHRVELRPLVAAMPGPNAGPSACSATAEVFDPATGRTWSFTPQPLPDLPAVQSN